MNAPRLHISLIKYVLAALTAAVLLQFDLHSLESFFYDLRVRWTPTHSTSNKVVTLAIDRRTLEELNHLPNLSQHTQILDLLKEHKPLALTYLLLPAEFKSEGSSHSSQFLIGSIAEKKQFVQAAKRLPNFYFATQEVPMRGLKPISLPSPYESLPIVSSAITSDASNFAQDNVSRRTLLTSEGQSQLHVSLAQLVKPIPSYRGAFLFKGSIQTWLPIHAASQMERYSFVDLLKGRVSPEVLKDKIVIIGLDTQADTQDYVRTSFSKDSTAMSKLEFYANMVDGLILDQGVRKAPDYVNWLITFLFAILTVYAIGYLTPVAGLVVIALSTLSMAAVAFLLFAFAGFWMDMIHPLMVTFICYYLLVPYRWIQESRKSWEYQQKNRLLKQVDELKSNFLNMMSHDLKTPLARIQGMVEVVQKDKQSALSSQQQEALKTISQSTEELGVFISSVLSLSRIESKEVKLHLESRDINVLIKEVIQKYAAIAKEKNIEIRDELEPLFSIKMDPDLIRQVIANLIENAIKYSPPHSRILITTEETDGKISLQVADQGIGIPKEELGKIFTKFYRTSNAKHSAIKGSGLGLYLAKYFVELHHGQIQIDSFYSQGTTVTVQLPLEA